MAPLPTALQTFNTLPVPVHGSFFQPSETPKLRSASAAPVIATGPTPAEDDQKAINAQVKRAIESAATAAGGRQTIKRSASPYDDPDGVDWRFDDWDGHRPPPPLIKIPGAELTEGDPTSVDVVPPVKRATDSVSAATEGQSTSKQGHIDYVFGDYPDCDDRDW